MSRNKNRTGGASQPDTAVPPALSQGAGDGGFSFVVPTEFVELPSEGRFYPESHPLHNQDVIEIKQMTAKEEDILTSQTLLKQGVALDRLLQSLIVDKRINPASLLSGDRSAIIVAARRSGYGSVYESQMNCPSCGTKQEFSFNLNGCISEWTECNTRNTIDSIETSITNGVNNRQCTHSKSTDVSLNT